MFVETKFFHKAGEGSGGGGGGDSHNKGSFLTPEALRTAHPTAQPGDFAIVESTDTVWVWDSDTSNWKDGDTKGQVTSVNGQTGAVTVDALPSQTGQSGKFLTTNGTDASWSDKPLVNTATGANSVGIVGTSSGGMSVVLGKTTNDNGAGANVLIGYGAKANNWTAGYAIGIGYSTKVGGEDAIAIGDSAESTAQRAISIGHYAKATAKYAIQIGGTSATNSDANTMKVANTNGNFELMSANGTIPADRLPNAINKYSTMPTAASTNVGWIVQYTGTTDSTYTHGYIYECKAQGTDPETYAWEAVEVQAGGGSSLPSQTGNSGKFLTTDGTDASWATISALQNTATGTDSLTILGTATNQAWAVNLGAESRCQAGLSVAVGRRTKADAAGAVVIGAGSSATQSDAVAIGQTTNATGRYGIAIGSNTTVSQNNAIAIGTYSYATATNAIQLGANGTNSEAGTFCVASKYNNTNVNYKMMDADGTIPAARHATLPAADGTYTLQLVIADGVPTLSWVAA